MQKGCVGNRISITQYMSLLLTHDPLIIRSSSCDPGRDPAVHSYGGPGGERTYGSVVESRRSERRMTDPAVELAADRRLVLDA